MKYEGPIPIEKVFNRTPIEFTHNSRVIRGAISGHPERNLYFYSSDQVFLKLFPDGMASLPNQAISRSEDQAFKMRDFLYDLRMGAKEAWERLPDYLATTSQ